MLSEQLIWWEMVSNDLNSKHPNYGFDEIKKKEASSKLSRCSSTIVEDHKWSSNTLIEWKSIVYTWIAYWLHWYAWNQFTVDPISKIWPLERLWRQIDHLCTCLDTSTTWQNRRIFLKHLRRCMTPYAQISAPRWNWIKGFDQIPHGLPTWLIVIGSCPCKWHHSWWGSNLNHWKQFESNEGCRWCQHRLDLTLSTSMPWWL
jgi:hypothetical protein